MLPMDLPTDMPSFMERFGTDEKCRVNLIEARWPKGFCCGKCGHSHAWSHKKRLIEECAACGKQHSLRAGTIFEQSKTGLAKWFLAIFLVTSSKRGIAAAELQRQMGFASYQTAWTWLHKIRRAMVRPEREPLKGAVEADETYIGGRKPGKRGRGAAGKALVVGAVECRRETVMDEKTEEEKVCLKLGRLRLAHVGDAGGATLCGFISDNVRSKTPVMTDSAKAYSALAKEGYDHEPTNLSASGPEGLQRLSAIHLVFGQLKRWLLGTHHGGQSPKHLPAYLDEFVFRFNRRTAKCLSHRFARVLQIAVRTTPVSYAALVAETS